MCASQISATPTAPFESASTPAVPSAIGKTRLWSRLYAPAPRRGPARYPRNDRSGARISSANSHQLWSPSAYRTTAPAAIASPSSRSSERTVMSKTSGRKKETGWGAGLSLSVEATRQGRLMRGGGGGLPPVSAGFAGRPCPLRGITGNRDINQIVKELPASAKGKGGKSFRATIPVYFHVVHAGGVGNISDKVIAEQMRVLNAAFAGFDGGAATGFSFELEGVTRDRQCGVALRRADHLGRAGDEAGGRRGAPFTSEPVAL